MTYARIPGQHACLLLCYMIKHIYLCTYVFCMQKILTHSPLTAVAKAGGHEMPAVYPSYDVIYFVYVKPSLLFTHYVILSQFCQPTASLSLSLSFFTPFFYCWKPEMPIIAVMALFNILCVWCFIILQGGRARRVDFEYLVGKRGTFFEINRAVWSKRY